jgi:chromosome segregation protein
VQSGWEKAVETVLGSSLQAVCVDDVDAVLSKAEALPAGDLTLFESAKNGQEKYSNTSLASIVTSDLKAMEVLKTVHIADSLAQAKELIRVLDKHESVITKDGNWLYADTVCFQANDESNSVLVLEKEKKELTIKLKKLSAVVAEKEQVLTEARVELTGLEQQSRELRQQEAVVVKQVSQLAMQINDKRSKVERDKQRLLQVEMEITQAVEEQEKDNVELAACRQALERAIEQSAQLETKRESLQQQRSGKKGELDDVRQLVHSTRELTHSLLLKIESQRSFQALTNQNSEVLNERMQQAVDKVSVLQVQLAESDEPLVEQQSSLDELLKERLVIDEHLADSRVATEEVEQAIRALEVTRHEAEQLVQQAREKSSAAKISHQEVLVRKQTLVEQMQESGVELDETLNEIPEEANDIQWQEQVNRLAEKINRLGPINLTAIEEYEAQSERKQYLDSQQLDLTDSLKTLSAAIEKIDKESRTLFKQTFDKVNEGFEKRFPKLFGGGHAYLQQMGEDLLETGVTVMARPPGKRNSSIHMLSGGEKALTAVALVFSIFDLNPSPFCMLDEVDAPLDEANVGRFGELVKEMSSHVQMILITHNKATMEMANQLSGVTMKEPGVSRLVAVDLDQATKMVAS